MPITREPLDFRGINFEDGYIAVLDKPLRWTSTDVVRKVKFALRKLGYRKIKVGHAGTLDPLASGILLVCIGRATKLVDALQAEEKEYIADVMLGATTPSYDLEHEIDQTYPYEHITREAVEEALASLTGERLQTPPVYSAKKIEGTRAYELARAGEEVANFSFIMVIPVILGKMLLDICSGEVAAMDIPAGALVGGFLAAFISGTLACKFMIEVVKRGKLIWFALYCCLAGLVSIVFSIL